MRIRPLAGATRQATDAAENIENCGALSHFTGNKSAWRPVPAPIARGDEVIE
jgi:hypothetical protein